MVATPTLFNQHTNLIKKDRTAVSSSEWRAQIQAIDTRVKEHLRTKIVGGFNEEQFGAHIGFANLRR